MIVQELIDFFIGLLVNYTQTDHAFGFRAFWPKLYTELSVSL